MTMFSYSDIPNVTMGTAALLTTLLVDDSAKPMNFSNNQTTAIVDNQVCEKIAQAPMGAELKKVLFADPEFKKYYDEFSKELDDDLDQQFHDGKISPMKYYRMKRGITQSELGKAINIDQPHISRMESKSKLNISSGKLLQISKALNISMEMLLNEHSG